MIAALKTALREACAEIREHRRDAGYRTKVTRIETWERLAEEAELVELAQEPTFDVTDEALAAMLGVPVAMVAPYRCPQHGDLCRAAACCCADLHEPEQPTGDPGTSVTVNGETYTARAGVSLTVDVSAAGGAITGGAFAIGDRDIKPENVTRTAADIRAEIYGMPPYSGPGLKHGPGGTGRAGPCDANCRKCALREAEIAALADGHVGVCKGPEEREISGNDFGPRGNR